MSGLPTFEVLRPGLLTTVQDAGRPDAVHLGVPVGGACDPWSLMLANALAGNDGGAATLEITLQGPSLRVLADCDIGLAGADFDARVSGTDARRLTAVARHALRASETVEFDTPREATGIRAYLAIAGGGVDVPRVLGSRSTCLAGAFGGFDGRPLQPGDVIRRLGDGADPTAAAMPATELSGAHGMARRLRVACGPDAPDGADDAALATLLAGTYTVSPRSDRQGIRLDGPRLELAPAGASILSRGVAWGAIQVPPDGQPICLLADHQTVGGYPVVAVVATVDRPALGQLGPGDEVGFELITLAEAQRLRRRQAQTWAKLLDDVAAPR